MARRTIVVGINQTIMAALSMVTIAALIGGPGLGQVVLLALETTDVGTAFTGGLAVVILAIVLDRVTTAAERTHRIGLPVRKPGPNGTPTPVGDRYRRCDHRVAVYSRYTYFWASVVPGPAQGGVIGNHVSNGVSSATSWITFHFYDVTNGDPQRRHVRADQPAAGSDRQPRRGT